jgi:hypothetical protein
MKPTFPHITGRHLPLKGCLAQLAEGAALERPL